MYYVVIAEIFKSLSYSNHINSHTWKIICIKCDNFRSMVDPISVFSLLIVMILVASLSYMYLLLLLLLLYEVVAPRHIACKMQTLN